MSFYKALSVFLFLFLINVDVNAKSYYVSVNGSNENIGSIKSPFRNIQYAVDKVDSGDTVFIKSGSYNERITLYGVKGKKDQYITIENYPDNANVIVDGVNKEWGESGENRWGGLLDIWGSEYIKIRGLAIRNSYNAGVMIEESNHIMIENNKITDTYSSGVGVWDSSNIKVDSNEVTRACSGGKQESITISGVKYAKVSRNKISNNGSADGIAAGANGGEGIDIKEGSSRISVFGNEVFALHGRTGIYIDSWDKFTHDISVFNNKVYAVRDASGIVLACELGDANGGNGRLKNIYVFNNIVYNNDGKGIQLAGWVNEVLGNEGALRKMEDIYILNNTVYNNSEGGIVISNNDAKKVLISNNILSENSKENYYPYQFYIENNKKGYEIITAYEAIDSRSINIISNMFDFNANVDYVWTYHENNIIDIPEFKNPASADFRLKAISPAIDAGKDTAPIVIVDFDGVSRSANGITDIGAFEYH